MVRYLKGLKIIGIKQDMPISRSLGSSSTCMIGELVGANEILEEKFLKMNYLIWQLK